MNLARNLERSADFFPDRVAVIEGDARTTYGRLNEEAGRIACALAAKGIKPGDRVALCSPNSARWLAFYFGVLKCGAVAVTLSAMLSPPELALLLRHCRPVAAFTTAERAEEFETLREEIGLRFIVRAGEETEAMMSRAEGPLSAVDRDRDDTAAILYTGGTTGLPKGVMLSHNNINSAIHNVVFYERSTENDRALCFLPFNHVFGQMHIMNATIYSGGGLVLLPGFDMDKVLHAVRVHEVTKFFSVPTIYVRFLQVPGIREKLGGVRYCFSAAASMARELVSQWRQETGLNIHEAYGLTESASMATYNHYHQHVVGSVGTAAGTVELTVRDMEGRLVEQGLEGEIWLRGPNIMKGYLENEEANREAFHDGWFRSGDIGYTGERGYLFLVDRLKDMIITGGENVYPREVEEALCSHPDVIECAVIGLPDREYGERVAAYIVPRRGPSVDGPEMKSFLKARLSPFKVPKEYVAVDHLPTSPAGKILKRELRKQVIEGK